MILDYQRVNPDIIIRTIEQAASGSIHNGDVLIGIDEDATGAWNLSRGNLSVDCLSTL